MFWRQRIAQAGLRATVNGRFDLRPETVAENEDDMLPDWLARLVVSNWLPVTPYLDLVDLVGQSRWVESTAELDALFPVQSTMRRWLAHWAKMAF